MSSNPRWAALAAFLLVALAATAHAQSTASLRGRVTDEQGARRGGSADRGQEPGDRRRAFDGQRSPGGSIRCRLFRSGAIASRCRAPGSRPPSCRTSALEVAQAAVQNVKLSVGGRTEEVAVVGETPVDRDRHHLLRDRDRPAHRAGDPAQRPPLRGPRPADPRLRRAAAGDRLPDGAAARPGLVRLQHRRQPRRHGQLHDQRHQPERPGPEPDHVPAVDQHRAGVQGRQLDAQRRVRPQLRARS